ncbi:hypothetical protein THARTR1_07146 [Trichoderma harzianum]|uniref:Uncharacterized protein n=1 Tax=Trichoderma harzianum TaxID=5544 RepID=A0A2K0U2D6_TRIHA|nr:hypothetical protein THARTR1_07146 [Trichoderma harzianum]
MVKDFAIEEVEAWLTQEEVSLRKSFEEKLAGYIKGIMPVSEEREQAAKLKALVEARKTAYDKSDEFIRLGDGGGRRL